MCLPALIKILNCKLSSLCYSDVSLVKWISFLSIRVLYMLHNFCVIVMRMFSNVCWQVWDFCFTHLYLKMQKGTSVTRGAECGGMFWLVTFRICGENLHNSQRLDMYRLRTCCNIYIKGLFKMHQNEVVWVSFLTLLLGMIHTPSPLSFSLFLCLLNKAVHFISC